MKKIEARNLDLLVGGEHVLLALSGKTLGMWTVPLTQERYDKVLCQLKTLVSEYPQIDLFLVDIKEVTKPTFFANWYCVKDETNEVTHRVFDRKEYVGLKASLTDKTVFKIT